MPSVTRLRAVQNAAALCCALLACGASAQLSISHAGSAPLPASATDQHGAPFGVAGLSGITYVGESEGLHRFAAVMDNSDKLLFVGVWFGLDGSVESLHAETGLTLARRGDHEGIASPGGGTVLVSNESSSLLREFSLADGSLLRTLTVPAIYGSRRNNLGLESLSFDPAFAWTANEEALEPDGDRATPDHGTWVRLLRERTADDEAIAQHAYLVEPMHGPVFPFGNPGQSGLSDLVALPDGSLLALERSLALANPLFLTRIYLVSFAGADDVSTLGALDGAGFTPAGKTLLYEGGHNNLEGLCLGPRLAGGGHALVGVVDDGDPVSTNTFVVFRLLGLEACPADVDGDGLVDIDDLHALHADPRDLDGDGLADERDRRCLEAYLRRHEALDMTAASR